MTIKRIKLEVTFELNTDERSVENVISKVYEALDDQLSSGEFDTADIMWEGEDNV
jgi:uncharacterized protein (DUF2267 family)